MKAIGRSGWLLAALTVLMGAALVHGLRSPGPAAAPDPRRQPAAHADSARAAEVRQRFDQAVMLHAKQFDHAATALHRVLELAPQLPEAHVNMGYALLGLGKSAAARDFFEGAVALAPQQANAYYGLALAWEAQGDLPMALGAMRSYLHLARGESEAHLRRARAALWEWESRRRPAAPPPTPPLNPTTTPPAR
jgi:tetratricopeptide (TPR) repeat protein